MSADWIVALVVRRLVVEGEIDFEMRIHPIAERERRPDIIADIEGRAALERQVGRVQVDQVQPVFPAGSRFELSAQAGELAAMRAANVTTARCLASIPVSVVSLFRGSRRRLVRFGMPSVVLVPLTFANLHSAGSARWPGTIKWAFWALGHGLAARSQCAQLPRRRLPYSRFPWFLTSLRPDIVISGAVQRSGKFIAVRRETTS